MSAYTVQTAVIARRLANVASHGSLSELSGEIRTTQGIVERLPARLPALSADEDERIELLDAVVQAMRRSVDRSTRKITSTPEGREVHLRLLRHLAVAPNWKGSCLTASGAV